MKKAIRKNKSQRQEAEVVNIPVVVHIIHNGEPEGFGINIPTEQILSQIEVINEDFRRLNEDRVNTPDEFIAVAADIELTFSLAVRDPEGLPTDGIVRVDGGKDIWFVAEDYNLKSQSFWPSEDYLNIWVTDLGDGFIGYAQFPVSPLPGLEDGSNSRLTDGIVVDYRAFGSILKFPAADLNPRYNLGRTTSHEIGHYFGLRHIWGDGNCSQDDFCNDTPPQSSDNNGLGNCSYPGRNTCSSDNPNLADMFQNYMDYTNDVCMNLFTEDQKARMRTVLDNSPRRVSLKTSLGDDTPVMVANDLGFRNIVSPTFSICGDTFFPEVEVRNYGTNEITQYSIQALIDNLPVATYNGQATLNLLDIETVRFEEVALPNNDFELSFQVLTVNSTTDGNDENDQKLQDIIVPPSRVGLAPVGFTQYPLQWRTFNNDDLETWELILLENNGALYMNNYDYENEGAIDFFSSPSFSLLRSTTAKLVFDVAFAKYPQIDLEGLLVVITPQCLDPLTEGDTLYYKLGDELASAGITSASFVPQEASDWRSEQINLAPYIGQEDLQITFIGINGYGNNLYLDNIEIQAIENRIISPSPVSCLAEQELIIEIVNNSSNPISTYTINYQLDDGPLESFNGILPEPLNQGLSTELSRPLGILQEGQHNLSVTVTLPDNVTDQITHQFYVDNSQDIIPIRENMNDIENSPWIIVNHDNDITWQQEAADQQTYLSIENGNYINSGEQDWFVSPVLDFGSSNTAILTFEMAYSELSMNDDQLAILVSTNCGETYDNTEFINAGSELFTGSFETIPGLSDWRLETIDLSGYAGLSDIRIAFVSTNNMGSTLFIDDIQVYVNDFITDTQEILFPNPTTNGIFNLKFDLDRKESLRIVIYNSAGQPIQNVAVENTLNQAYSFDIANEPPGVYIVKILGETFVTSKRLLKTF